MVQRTLTDDVCKINSLTIHHRGNWIH